MRTAEFLAQMQLYYGQEYGPEMPVIGRYLEEKSDAYRDALANVVVLRYSRKWRTLPDVAVFEDCAAETRDKVASALAGRALPGPLDDDVDEETRARIGAELRELVAKLRVNRPA